MLERLSFPKLERRECEQVHEASLTILESLGVRLDLPEAVELLLRHGARRTDSGLVQIPKRLVYEALEKAPRKVTLFNRQGEPKMPIEDHSCFYGPGSDCLNIIDHRDGKRRQPVLRDVKDGVLLCDGLMEIDFVMSMLLPGDVDKTLADRFQMEVMLTHTTKPIIYVTYEFRGCVDCVTMAEAVAGSPEALRRAPNVACYINVTSGLLHNIDALQKLLFLASKGLPALYIPSSTAGATSPITEAGALAVDWAGVLVGLVLSQLTREGTPVIIPGMPPGHIDMSTMVSTYAEPERGLAHSLGHHYGLPMFSFGGVSEAKVVDQQAAAEAALTLMAETVSGGNIIHDLGYLESGLTFSFAQLAICAEMVSWIKALTRKVEVNAETLGLPVVSEVGPGGHFLNTQHTYDHFRKRWYPKIFERANYESWAEKGRTTLADRAAARVESILSLHQPDPLPPEAKRRLKKALNGALLSPEQ